MIIPINDEEIVVKKVWTKPILRTILEISDPGWDAYMAEVAEYVVYQDFTFELPEIGSHISPSSSPPTR